MHGQLRPLRFTTAAMPLLVNCCLGSFGTPFDGRAISQLSAACGACVTFASFARAHMSSRGAFIDLSNLGTSICPHILSLTSISYHFCGTANLGCQHVGPAGLCCESVHRGHFETKLSLFKLPVQDKSSAHQDSSELLKNNTTPVILYHALS